MQLLTGGQAVVQTLKRAGVDRVFCVPGESFLSVLDALYDEPTLQLVTARHEESAANMALGYAQVSGKPGVVMASRAPGSTNLAISLYHARHDSTPLVALIGQVPRKFRYRDAWQELDLPAFFRPLCKWTGEATSTARVPELVREALRVAASGRPGPTLVSLPADVLNDRAEVAVPEPPRPARPRPHAAELQAAWDLLAGARQPVVIAGGGVLRAGAVPLLVALAARLALPVATAFRRHDAFPNDHPLYLGPLGLGPAEALLEYVAGADVVLAIGTRLSQVTTANYALPAPGTRVIHIDADPDTVGVLIQPEVGMVADAGAALADLLALADARGARAADFPPERTARVASVRQSGLADPLPGRPAGGVHPLAVVHALQELLPPEAIVTSDAGNFYAWLSRYFRFRRPGTYLGPTSGGMGFGLPAAVGAKLAAPDRPVVCVAGDGGLMMGLLALEPAVRYNVPVVAVIFNNGMQGTIRWYQENTYPGRVIGTDVLNPDFMALACSFGAHGEQVTADAAIRPALARALAAGKPALVDVQVDREWLSLFQRLSGMPGGRPPADPASR